jgi:hypothetical protein
VKPLQDNSLVGSLIAWHASLVAGAGPH